MYNLAEELVRRGHDVTLFASGDSKTSAKLSYTYPRAAYRDNVPWENFLYPLEHIAAAFERADEFDVIHVHLNRSQDYAALVLAGMVSTPTVFTLHFELPTPRQKDRADRREFLLRYRDRNFVSISDAQRTLELNYVATVYNGLDFSRFEPATKPGDKLVWLGRFCREKGTSEAIKAARLAKSKLLLAGKIDSQKREYLHYYETEVAPHIDGRNVAYVGEVNDSEKVRLFRKARAFLAPVMWNEPFGLTVIEAMAMGVPAIAFDRGPMRELIVDGKTGFVVANVRQMAAAVKRADALNRSLISSYAKSHFSVGSMTDGYLKAYERVMRKAKAERIDYALEKANA